MAIAPQHQASYAGKLWVTEIRELAGMVVRRRAVQLGAATSSDHEPGIGAYR